MIHYDASAFRRFGGLSRRWSVTMPAMLRSVASLASMVLLEAAQGAIPKKTGRTARGLRVRATHGMGTVRLEVVGDKIAQYLITGTAAHEIRPVHARALYFHWQRQGRWVFFTRVNHPGTRPNDWRRPARDRAHPRIKALGIAHVRSMIATMKREAH